MAQPAVPAIGCVRLSRASKVTTRSFNSMSSHLGRPSGRSAAGCSSDRRFEPLTRSGCCRAWVLWTRVPRMPSRPPAQPDRSVPRKIGGSLRGRAVTRRSGCGQTTASRGCSRPNATLSTLWRRMAIMHNLVPGCAWKRLQWLGTAHPPTPGFGRGTAWSCLPVDCRKTLPWCSLR